MTNNLPSRLKAATCDICGTEALELGDDLARALYGADATFSHADLTRRAIKGSLDASLALVGEVLPGWCWAVSEGARASLQKGPAALSRGSIPITAKHKSAPIALLLALLKCLEDSNAE